MDSIEQGWSSNPRGRGEGVVDKIRNCRHEISVWRKANPPYGKETISNLQKALEEVQNDMSKSEEEVIEVSRKLKEAYRDEELYWEQKSRTAWHVYGDRNTNFYHALTKQRRIQNRITGLYNENEVWTNSEIEIEKVAVNYFEKLFKSTSPADFEGFLAEIPESVTSEQNRRLTALATEEEVRKALFLMHPEKAPGPDGNILIAQEMFHGIRTNNACKEKFMAIKTDMSKAYDRVEWLFMERLLLKMGFCSRWVSRIMTCISSVSYKVLLNGQPKGSIVPERGLRQGDPLSSYLFILCTEALIVNIKKEERNKRLTGLKLLKDYEDVSGQLINFDKSSLQFGHKVPDVTRVEIKTQLGISTIGGMANYLGIPESLGGSKIQVFGYVTERINQKINSWTVRFLTKGGKEVLIKSAANAMPNHVMSCYRLPKAVTKKITGAISHFWWGGSGNKKGIHWLSWDKVCKHKDEGGLSFKDLQGVNTALLAKQLWRIIDKPECLFSKVFKGRYFRNTDPMDPHRSYSPSYGWRSICSARSLINKGLIKRVGHGNSISVWSDPWIPAPRPRSATPKTQPQVLVPSLKVDYFINPATLSWDEDLLNAFIHTDDVNIIKGLAISRSHRPDQMDGPLRIMGAIQLNRVIK
ncbi:uncharacterized protein LOC108858352 [Raphanus sativus]|uniref:Uncharacterized protein LOC108858352 n=1 Tax=Raphanus sativus TaxID=3726 RepID=A0A9W3DET8_RAPSA|nr:uncharacterized protein LOC108858352 [Raphanus sativus]